MREHVLLLLENFLCAQNAHKKNLASNRFLAPEAAFESYCSNCSFSAFFFLNEGLFAELSRQQLSPQLKVRLTKILKEMNECFFLAR